MAQYIKKFDEISMQDVPVVGGKGASLGELLKAGISVPAGFVVTTEGFQAGMSDELKKEVLEAFDELGCDLVAVRSSAVAEDSSSASWAGQLESYLNTTREELIGRVEDCWNSVKSERALAYAQQHKIAEQDLVVAVVVQKMVDAEAAGVMFTVNPVTKNKNQMMIEACFGLGELLVQGLVTPDNYVVSNGEIVEKTLNSQETMLKFVAGETKEVVAPHTGEQILNGEQIVWLSAIGKKIEEHYGKPQDIEWALEDGKIYIVQARPITTL